MKKDLNDISMPISIVKITNTTLFLSRYRTLILGGVYGVFEALYSFILMFLLFFYLEGLEFYIYDFLIVLSILVIVMWRMISPICFNRKNKTVSYWHFGVLYQKKWEDIEFYYEVFSSSKGSTTVLAFTLRGGNKIKFDKVLHLYGLSNFKKYLISYMENEDIEIDEELLRYIRLGNFEYKFSEIFSNILPKKITFFMVVFSPLIVIGILLYYVMFILNKILPRRKIPKELLEACGCEENEKVYG